jgi:hypothetical protein
MSGDALALTGTRWHALQFIVRPLAEWEKGTAGEGAMGIIIDRRACHRVPRI